VIALSRLLTIGIGVFLVVFLVWLYALMKTSKQADEFMDQRWLEKQWLAEFSEAGNADRSESAVRNSPAASASEFYDQDDVDG
jgi:hypothetical protein